MKVKYYVKELGLAYPRLKDAESALANAIKKDGWDLVFVMRVENTFCYCGASIVQRQCPYTVPGYTIEIK